MPLDLNVRPVVDEKYIIPKTLEFIKTKAAAKKPFFVHIGYSEAHAPLIANPAFAGKSAQRGGVYSDIIGEMDYRVGQILDAIKEALHAQKNIEVRGFGTFKIRQRKTRMARNPRTGSPVEVSARPVPVFKPSKELRALVADLTDEELSDSKSRV